MAGETILQHEIATNFVYPFFIIFLLVYALLEKTKLLGEKNKQVNAIFAFIVGLIFVSVAYPKMVVGNLILFLTVGLVVVFVGLLLWGMATGNELKDGTNLGGNYKKAMTAVVIIALVIAVIWATGIDSNVVDLLFYQTWSKTFWTNALFIVAIGIALAIVLLSKAKE